MLPSPCTLQPVFVDRLHCHLCNVMFRHVVSKRVDSSESLLPTSRDKVYEQVGVYSSYYILLVLSPKGDSKGPDRCSAKNNKTLVRKEPKGRMQSTITSIVCSALMPNVTCTDAERDCIDAECDVHNHADALRPPCFGDKTDGEEIVLSQGNRGIKVSRYHILNMP